MLSKSVPILILVVLLSVSNSGTQLDSVIGNLIKWYRLLKNIKQRFPDIPGIKPECHKGFMEQKNRTWKYVDASGKPESGINEGNIYWLGDYNECLELGNSKYCTLLNIKVKKKATVFGACVPSACTENDIEVVFGWVANLTGPDLLTVDQNPLAKYWGNYNVTCTDGEDSIEMKKIHMGFVLTIYSIILLLNLIGTVYHIIRDFLSWTRKSEFEGGILLNDDDSINNENRMVRTNQQNRNISDQDIRILRNIDLDQPGNNFTNFIMCFSLIRNTKAIFKQPSIRSSHSIIKAANGIRFFSLCWIILGHMLLYAVLYAPADNVVYVKSKWLHRFAMQALLNSTVAVDTFFLLSGMLVSYLCLKRLDRVGALNYKVCLRYYLNRFIRILPSYLFVLVFYIYIFPEISGGPFWFPHTKKSYKWKSCSKNWWTNLLFINDFYPLFDSCFEWSWYLAVDMQFYFFSPLFVYLVNHGRWKKMSVLLLIIIASLSAKGVVLYKLNATPIFNTRTFEGVEKWDVKSSLMLYLDKIYTKPYFRITPYLIGIVLGWCVFKKKKLPDNKKLILCVILWLSSIAVTTSIVYGPANESNWTTAKTITYGVLFRPAWALAVAWIIYACHSGYGELVNEFLSWKIFIPLTRVSFSTLLVHVMVIIVFYGSLQQPMHIDDITFFCLYCGITFISYFVGYLVTVFIEYPVYNFGTTFGCRQCC